MSQSGGGRPHRARRSPPCRAGDLDDDTLAELRQRVADDAVVDVALLFAHAAKWQDERQPAHDRSGETSP